MQIKRVSNEQGVINLCEVAAQLLKTMEINAATKYAVREVLREAVNKNRPKYRGNANYLNASHRSLASRDSNGVGLVTDHAIPLSLMILEVYTDSIYETRKLVDLCKRYSTLVLITADEHAKLEAIGLKKAMPDDWDHSEIFARYITAGIVIEPNADG